MKRLLILLPLLLLIVSPCSAKSVVKQKLLDVPASVVVDHRPFKDRICNSTSYSETGNVRISQVLLHQPDFLAVDDLLSAVYTQPLFYSLFYAGQSAPSDEDLSGQPYYILYRQLLFYS